MMGKAQRFSKGHSLGFVPDYRYAVETVGESEVFGSPARIDSEDSCALPKRKCISLNVESAGEERGGNLGLHVPREVFSLPRMSSSERKGLEMRLREELQQVKVFQKRLLSAGAAVGVNGVTLSAPGSDVHVKKPDGKLHRSNSVQSVRGIGVPPSVAPPVVSTTNYAVAMKQCGTLLKRLMGHHYAWVFNVPVDVEKLNLPDYFQLIKHPMDLGTVQKKLTAGVYSTPWDFAADVRLTFTNALTYNPPGTDVNIMADAMSKIFESRWKSAANKFPPPEDKPLGKMPPKKGVFKKDFVEKEDPFEREPSKKGAFKKDIFDKEDVVGKPVSQPKKRKASPLVRDTPVVQTAREVMTDEQRYNLSERLQSYGCMMPEHIVEFIRRYIPNDSEGSEDELLLDIDAVSDETLFDLQKLLDYYDRVNQSKNPTKDETCEVEIQNEYGLRNSSTRHDKGNELIEEDIDIGGNDLPVSTFPPVVIEKENTHRSSKHSTSSSSSSDSGSSSSNSESSSSSGSDSDVKIPASDSGAKEKILSGASLDQEQDSLNRLNIPEQITDPVPVSVDGELQTEGENVSEKQASPEKEQRAALLKRRFADTILKAREKNLDQVAKKDPEKLRHEKEELERLKRQERARLQAEARAAEDARKRAEAAAAAEAAAEARRQRELEREAARRALQQMEKTVEINEGGLFLKDLEMLRTVPGEQIPSSVGDISPVHPPDGLGGFQLGSNPLERLGLYMKNDDEEDEEGESEVAPAMDVEEGEID